MCDDKEGGVALVNVNKLRGKIVEKNCTVETLAEKIGINKSTLYRRINGGGIDFTIGEVYEIVDALGLTVEEAVQIFFASDVA